MKVVILNDTRSDHHHGCARVMNTLDFFLKKYDVSESYYVLNNVDWQLDDSIKQKIISSDIIIVNGEGTIHHNAKAGLHLVQVARFAKAYNIKCYLINSTFESNDEEYGYWLKYFDRIFVRETLSKEELNRLKITSEVVPDLSFYFNTEFTKKTKNNTRKIMINDSVKKEITTALCKNTSNNSDVEFVSIFYKPYFGWQDALENIFQIIKKNTLRELLIKVLDRLWRKLFDASKKVKWVGVGDHIFYADKLSSFDLVVTGRYHTVAFCVNHGVPFAAIKSNSHKIEGLLMDIGLDVEKYIIEPNMLNKNFLDKYEPNIKDIELMQSFSQDAKVRIEKMFHNIFNIYD